MIRKDVNVGLAKYHVATTLPVTRTDFFFHKDGMVVVQVKQTHRLLIERSTCNCRRRISAARPVDGTVWGKLRGLSRRPLLVNNFEDGASIKASTALNTSSKAASVLTVARMVLAVSKRGVRLICAPLFVSNGHVQYST